MFGIVVDFKAPSLTTSFKYVFGIAVCYDNRLLEPLVHFFWFLVGCLCLQGVAELDIVAFQITENMV
uniref:Uncharacterized protein n=1 Tax=Arundo donax TaxID=35708 RepID=A0A0A9FHT0_ARUDO